MQIKPDDIFCLFSECWKEDYEQNLGFSRSCRDIASTNVKIHQSVFLKTIVMKKWYTVHMQYSPRRNSYCVIILILQSKILTTDLYEFSTIYKQLLIKLFYVNKWLNYKYYLSLYLCEYILYWQFHWSSKIWCWLWL